MLRWGVGSFFFHAELVQYIPAGLVHGLLYLCLLGDVHAVCHLWRGSICTLKMKNAALAAEFVGLA